MFFLDTSYEQTDSPFSEVQLILLEEAANTLRRRGLDPAGNSSTDTFYLGEGSSSNVNQHPQLPIYPEITPNQPAVEVYSDQLFSPTFQSTSPTFALQGPSGMANKLGLCQPSIGTSTLPHTGPQSMAGEAWAAGGGVPVGTMSAPYPHPYPPVPMAGAIYGQGTSVVPHATPASYPADDFAADSQHHLLNHSNNINANYDLVPPLLENQYDLSISIETDDQITDSIHVSTTAVDAQSYSPPISLPRLSVPLPSAQSESIDSGYEQDFSHAFPSATANFTAGIGGPTDANLRMPSPMLPPPGNLQWVNHLQSSYQGDAQYPPSVLPLVSSWTGVVRTSRGTTRQQSTPMGRRRDRNVTERPNLEHDGYVICQWQSCGQSFSTTDDFENHCRRDHLISGSKPIKAVCHWCGCTRGVIDSLLRHILCQHARAKFLCPRGCGKSTSRRYAKHKCAATTPAVAFFTAPESASWIWD